ncbi:MFS transporter [Streptomyces sp. KR2]|uniref:MFS transporter n=1 Tax=Streptomyces sp. KR2 TaxID=1514824 RepID=UPI003F7DDC3B
MEASPATAPPAVPRWLPAGAALAAAGWGANQFTPLAAVHRTQEQWHPVLVAVLFTAYLPGLLPGLLLGGPAADRFGRRRVVRAALLLSAAASALPTAAASSPAAVCAGRLATGVAAGFALSAGTRWLRELCAAAGRPGAGERRAACATGAGLAGGALAAGMLAEWLPAPTVLPCLVHAALALLALAATTCAPETTGGTAGAPLRLGGWCRRTVGHPRFVWVVLPASPAVFGAATVAYVVLPPLVADEVPGYAPLFSGVVAALTLSVGVVAQPLAVRLHHARTARATLAGMVTVIGGLLVGALAAYGDSVALVLVAAVLLGAGYGLTLGSGLLEIARLAPPSALPCTAFLHQGAAYSGFLTPLLLAVTAGAAPYPALLTGMAVVGLLCLWVTARFSRGNPP